MFSTFDDPRSLLTGQAGLGRRLRLGYCVEELEKYGDEWRCSQLDVDAVDVHVRIAARAGSSRLVVRRRVTARPPNGADVSAVQFDVDRRAGRHGAGLARRRALLPPVARHRHVVVVVDVVVVVVARRRPLSAVVLVPGAVPVVAAVVRPVAGRRPTDVVPTAAARSSVPDRITVGRVRCGGSGGGPRRRRRNGMMTLAVAVTVSVSVAVALYRAGRASR